MKWFPKRRGVLRDAAVGQCEHVVLAPAWDTGFRGADRVSLYGCEACGQTFTLEQAGGLRETETARLQRLVAS